MENNKKNGTKFENMLCELFAQNGYWSRPMYPAPDGSQPFDIMLISPQGNLFCIECKDCQNDKFPLSRIEMNQEISLRRLCNQYNLQNRVFFAFNTSHGVYFVHANHVLDKKLDSIFKKGGKSMIGVEEMERVGYKLSEFINYKRRQTC